jgi:hypothetical protein
MGVISGPNFERKALLVFILAALACLGHIWVNTVKMHHIWAKKSKCSVFAAEGCGRVRLAPALLGGRV